MSIYTILAYTVMTMVIFRRYNIDLLVKGESKGEKNHGFTNKNNNNNK